MKKRKKERDYRGVVLLIVLAFLILTTVYYLLNQDRLDRRTPIVGDGVCGSFVDEEGQDFCCSRAHEDDVRVQCVGSWEYVSGQGLCQYVCEGALPACQEDARTCEDGGTVVRNASNECRFNEC